MRIAQVAPLVESVPPKHYGGTERIVAYLTEELVRFGHKVSLFASGDSVTSAELVPVCRRSFRQNKRATDYLSREVLLMDHVMQRAGEFDVIHFHTGCLHYLDFTCAAHSVAVRKLAGDDLSWITAGFISVSPGAWQLSGISGTRFAGEASRSGHRDCQASGDAAQDRGESRSR
jgi:glycosyltransferase involved in cell wall biosynthesis